MLKDFLFHEQVSLQHFPKLNIVQLLRVYFAVFLINYLYAEKDYKILLWNKELFISIFIISIFIIIYRDVWYFNLFFLVLSVLLLALMFNQFKKLLHIKNEDFFNQGEVSG